MKKRLISTLISVLLIFSIIPCFSASAMTILSSYSATINGVKVTQDSYPGQKNCWKYANGIYKKIWGCNFTSDFTGSKTTDYNMLREMSDGSGRAITLSTVKNYLNSAPLGAVIRVCRTSSTAYSDGSDGHSLILVGKDSKGFYFFEDWGAGSSGYNAVATYYTFQEFVTFNTDSKDYNYFKYIKWPSAGTYATDYTVKYNANGGTGAPTKQGKSKDIALELSSTVPTRDEYAFVGWATTATATEPKYYAHSSYTANKSITLYAVWKKATDLGNSFTAKIRNPSFSKYLTIQTDGNVASYSGNNKKNQLWTFTKQSDGSYKIKNNNNGYNLSITYAVSYTGGNVKTYYASDSYAQNWFLIKTNGKYVLYSKCTDKILSVESNSSKAGTNISTDINSQKTGQIFSILKDIESPTLSDLKVTTVSYNKLKVTGKLTDNVNTRCVKISSWTTENGNDDIVTDRLTLSSTGTFSYIINRPDHNYDYGDYSIKVVGYDSSINFCSTTLNETMPTTYSPKKTVEYNNHFYSVYNIALSAEKAKAFASSLGGHLVTITTKEEQSVVANALKLYGSKDNFFIGAIDTTSKNNYKWVTGEKFSYTNWAKGEPSNTAENYTYMYRTAYGTAKAGQWGDMGNYASPKTSSAYHLSNFGFVVEYDSMPTPDLTTISNTSNGIKIGFSQIKIASAYEIYRKLLTSSSYSKIATVTGSSNVNYVDTGVKSGKTYCYGVRSLRAGIASDVQSKPLTTTYVKASTLKWVTKASSSSIKIGWTKSSTVTGYKIYRKIGTGSFKLLKTITNNTTNTYTNTGLSNKKTYTYRVRAYKLVDNKNIFSVYSDKKSLYLS